MREIHAQKTGSDYSRLPSVTGPEPAAVSLAAFLIAALRSFLQGVSLAANFSLRRINNSAAETFNLPKQKILL